MYVDDEWIMADEDMVKNNFQEEMIPFYDKLIKLAPTDEKTLTFRGFPCGDYPPEKIIKKVKVRVNLYELGRSQSLRVSTSTASASLQRAPGTLVGLPRPGALTSSSSPGRQGLPAGEIDEFDLTGNQEAKG